MGVGRVDGAALVREGMIFRRLNAANGFVRESREFVIIDTIKRK